MCSLRMRGDFHIGGTGRAGIIGALFMSGHRGDATFRSADAIQQSAAGLSDSNVGQRRLARLFEAFLAAAFSFFFDLANAC